MKGSRPSQAHPWIGTLAVAALALTGFFLLSAPPALAADLLPDLVAPAPTGPRTAVEPLGDGQSHLLLRFNGYIHNVGPGALEIRGSSPVNGVMTVSGQRIYQDGGGFRDDNSRHPRIRFEGTDGHDHWHLQSAARFSLWNEAGTAEVAPSPKVGFCLQDVERIESSEPAVYTSDATEYCRQHQPGASSVFEGISPGWRDVYAAKLPFQWVDISDVAPGQYRLGAQVDPDNFVIESNEADNGPTLAPEIVTVAGYAPSPLAVSVARTQTIQLSATRYGSPGAPVFTIESAPRHGTLSSGPGAAVAGPVVYTPRAGFAGTDAFTFSARDPASPFPHHPPAAPVTVTVARKVGQSSKRRLLTRVRFSRRGRYLTVRAHSRKTGLLRLRVRKNGRRLGSCTKHARSGHRFRCRIKLRRHSSPASGKLVVSLLVRGKPTTADSFRVPRRLHR